jgi:hypothetical protein
MDNIDEMLNRVQAVDGNARLELLKKCVTILQRDFDSVQVFCTKFLPDKKETENYNYGDGDWYARFGHVSLWVEAEKRFQNFKTMEDKGDV